MLKKLTLMGLLGAAAVLIVIGVGKISEAGGFIAAGVAVATLSIVALADGRG